MHSDMDQMLFEAAGYRAIKLVRGDIPVIQTFLENNPEYFLLAEGRPPTETQAAAEFESELPEGWSFTEQLAIGFIDASNELTAFAFVISDLFAEGVWHLGLFIVSTEQHGQGVARHLYHALEKWFKVSGAKWVRLGVIAGNERAERFWERNGYIEVRRLDNYAMDNATHTIRVMNKPLGEAGLSQYLSLVSRDRPDAS